MSRVVSFEIVFKPARKKSIKKGNAIHIVEIMTDIPTKSGLSKNLKDLLINPRSFNISLNIPLRDAAIVRKSNATATGGTIQGMSRMLAIILLTLVLMDGYQLMTSL